MPESDSAAVEAGHPSRPSRHGVSIDVEDYRQILRARYQGEAGGVSAGFERDMDEVLGVLDQARTDATFFVSGAIAEQRPDLLRRWRDLGHEVASHGHSHLPIWTMTRSDLAGDLRRARAAIEDAIGEPARGYRAPVFSVRWDTLWALEVIRECGFTYDSSVVPVRMRRYGVGGFEPAPADYRLPSGRQIVEVPISAGRAWGRRVPLAGGGYFRLFSFHRIRRAVAEADHRGRPFVVYCHPDELGRQRFSAAGLATRWKDRLVGRIISVKSNVGRGKVRPAVERLLAEFRFGPLGRLAERVRADGSARVLGPPR